MKAPFQLHKSSHGCMATTSLLVTTFIDPFPMPMRALRDLCISLMCGATWRPVVASYSESMKKKTGSYWIDHFCRCEWIAWFSVSCRTSWWGRCKLVALSVSEVIRYEHDCRPYLLDMSRRFNLIHPSHQRLLESMWSLLWDHVILRGTVVGLHPPAAQNSIGFTDPAR